MTTGKCRVKVEIMFLLFQEYVAKVSITMPDNRRTRPFRIENDSGPFNQFAQAPLLPDPINYPSRSHQVIESYTLLFFYGYRKSDEFTGVKVIKSAARDAMPEKLVNWSQRILFAARCRERGPVNIEQPFALTRLSSYQGCHYTVILYIA